MKAEIQVLTDLISQAIALEDREVESKLVRLREFLQEQGLFDDPNIMLVFTRHKDTLDYLVGKLRLWNLTVTQIHDDMKIADRDESGLRIHAEHTFRTEAAGEGINRNVGRSHPDDN